MGRQNTYFWYIPIRKTHTFDDPRILTGPDCSTAAPILQDNNAGGGEDLCFTR